eukprot:GSChrysophyteH1.ASY1.ANO1.2097.1 assembled CDS
MSNTSRVTVAIRVKPESRAIRKCLSVRNSTQVSVGSKVFTYDHVFDEESTQSDVYTVVDRLIRGCFKGYNATIFAYGQTGSGKTHSVVGLPHDDDEEGIIPRAGHLSLVSECRDLLHTDIPSRDIMIREDRDGKIFFTEIGNLQRTTAGTHMNATSSRSHAIFSLNIELFEFTSESEESGQRADREDDEPEKSMGKYITSKLHLVDLAGSERAKKTGAQGIRLKESVGINQGLLALGKVIRALTLNSTADRLSSEAHVHVPYRESKLTRFLQDSLGGNSFTVMLACVSCADSNTHETLSTLTYATRARAVKNKVRANQSERNDESVDQVEQVVTALRAQLLKVQQDLSIARQERDSARGAHGVAKDEGNALLRSSATSLYDYGKARTRLDSKEEMTDVSMNEIGTVSSILPQLSEIQQSLEQGIAHLGSRTDQREITKLQKQLSEACDDLKKDEEIFQEKMQQMKKQRKTIKALEADKRALEEECTIQRQQLEKLLYDTRAQLLEDLEAVQEQRDNLLESNQEIESRYHDASKAATEQRQEFEGRQKELQKKLQQLEVGIRLKQACISDLVKSENEAAAAAESHSRKIRDLESERGSLLSELEYMRQAHEEAAEERQRRMQLEQRVGEAEVELEMLRKEARRRDRKAAQDMAETEKKKADLAKAEKLAAEMSDLRSEYTRVTSQLQNNETNHRKNLDRLTSQLSQHRKQSEESASRIKQLEAKNAELNSRLERNAKVLKARSGTAANVTPTSGRSTHKSSPGIAFGSSVSRHDDDISTVFTMDTQTTSQSRKSTNKRPATVQAPSSVYSTSSNGSGASAGSGSKAVNPQWVLKKVEDFSNARSARTEVRKLIARCNELDKERTAVQQELEKRRREADGKKHGHSKGGKNVSEKKDKYLRQIADIDSRLTRLRSIKSQKVHGSRSYRESEQAIIKLEQVKHDVQQKIDDIHHDTGTGAGEDEGDEGATTAAEALQDLEEELETLDAEYDLNSMRLQEEKKKQSRGPVSSKNVSNISAEAEMTALATELKARYAGLEPDQVSPLVHLSAALIESKHKSAADATEILQLQCQLDERESELEELMSSASKARAEYLRKAEVARQEADDKVAFLLQQLRQAEARTLETSSVLRRSQRKEAGDADSGAGNHANGVNSLLNSVHLGSLARENMLSRETSFSRDSYDEGSANSALSLVERQRMDALEKRNAELLRELRTLRSSTSTSGAAGQRA